MTTLVPISNRASASTLSDRVVRGAATGAATGGIGFGMLLVLDRLYLDPMARSKIDPLMAVGAIAGAALVGVLLESILPTPDNASRSDRILIRAAKGGATGATLAGAAALASGITNPGVLFLVAGSGALAAGIAGGIVGAVEPR